MAQFWLATFVVGASGGGPEIPPILPAGTKHLAIEVLQDGPEWAVLVSAADRPDNPRVLTCHLGFTNMAKACNLWLDRGFPLVDAVITMPEPGMVSVVSPFFGSQNVMQHEQQLLGLSGIDIGSVSPSQTSTLDGDSPELAPSYHQHRQVPDSAQPNAFMAKEPVTWAAHRRGVRSLSGTQVRFNPAGALSRCPPLASIANGDMTPLKVWRGTLDLPKAAQGVGNPQPPLSAAYAFGTPAFRFEDVEVLGFRINLAEQGLDFRDAQGHDFRRELERLIGPLNFHLREPTVTKDGRWRKASSDFRYRVATPTLVIELLRYGRMKALHPLPPLEAADSQGQHELLVRLLVGRVDDDSSQARSPAAYVPAIFVDNPWSKSLGRDAIGFDKRLAHFCIGLKDGLKRLLPDGRLAEPEPGQDPAQSKPEPLEAVTTVELVEQVGRPGTKLFELSLPPGFDSTALQPIDLGLTLGTSPLAGTRWRQSDFYDLEAPGGDSLLFRRSFAGQAIAESLAGFRMIQVAPVAARGTLQEALITGTFRFRGDLRVALPSGTATVTLSTVSSTKPSGSATPAAWDSLCRILGDGKTATIPVQSGSWYRLLCSMDLVIDDGLDWSG